LERASLKDTDLMQANLKGANLSKANLTNSKTYGWNIENVDFTQAIMPDGLVYEFENNQDKSIEGSNKIDFKKTQIKLDSQPFIIHTDKAPEPPNSRNQAVIVNGIIYVAAQIGIDPRLNQILHEEDVGKQTEQIMANLEIILTEAGATWADVVKTTIFLKEMKDFAAMNAVYANYFDVEIAPICACVAVAQLPKNALVQIECVALSQTNFF
jgi:2-iminobutanoate/2-iminopropanoate deaminase